MPLVIPIFIPHEGCPHSCVFCNQRRISGYAGSAVTAADVRATVQSWLDRNTHRADGVQVAFYGGSFTGLAQDRQRELLGAVVDFVEQGQIDAVRLSTRPDYIDRQGITLLQQYHVKIVELGVQSMDNQILVDSGRGHTTADVDHAVDLLKAAGMELGLQLMVGLPGETRRILRQTVRRVIDLQPDFVRIYPVLVVENSELARLYDQGAYQPISLDKAVVMTAWMKKKFDQASVRVVRMGLQAGPELEDAFIAGPWHPAFGELVKSRLMLQQTRKLLAGAAPGHTQIVTISPKDQSVFRGMQSKNIQRLKALNLLDRFSLSIEPDQPRQTVVLKPLSDT